MASRIFRGTDSVPSAKENQSRRPSQAGAGAADANRELIVSVAAGLFISKGFGSTTMQDIADALHISRPKLYYYFRDKSAILDAAVRNVPVEAERRARAALRRAASDPAAALHEMVKSHTQLILERPIEFRLLDMSMEHLASTMQSRAAKAKRGLLEAFTSVIRLGLERGRFRLVDPRIASFSMIGMANWTAAWYRPNGRLPANVIADQIADIALASVTAFEQRQPDSAPGIRESLRLLQNGVSHLAMMIELDSQSKS